MDATYAENYRRLYEEHWWWRARERIVFEELQSMSRRPGAERILDIGCGDGLFFERLASLGEVQGVEPWSAVSSQREGFPIHRCPLQDFRPDERFSLILLLDVVEHLSDPVRDVRYALSLLEPGGQVLITVPAFELLWTHHDDINHHQRRFTRASFATLADQAGLVIDKSRYFFHWTFAAKLLVRLHESLRTPEPRVERLPPHPINRMLLQLSLAEQRLLSSVPVPLGSSLMVVGHPSER